MKKLILLFAFIATSGIFQSNAMVNAMQSLYNDLMQHEAFAKLQLSEQHRMEFSELFYKLGELFDQTLQNIDLTEKGKLFVDRYKQYKGCQALQFHIGIGLRNVRNPSEEDQAQQIARKLLLDITNIRAFSMELNQQEQVQFALYLDDLFILIQKTVDSFEQIMQHYDQSVIHAIRDALSNNEFILEFNVQLDFPGLYYSYIISGTHSY